MDKFPVRPGHVLIIPKKHVDYIFDLDEKDYSEIFKIAKMIAGPLKKIMKCKRVMLSAGGFHIPHVHLHLIPSNKGLNLSHMKRRPAPQKKLREISEKIKKRLKTK